MLLRRAYLAATMIAFTGCASAPTPFRDTTNLTYAPELGVDLDAAMRINGIYVNEKAAGAGDPASPSSQVTVHYTLYLPDGTQVQSTRGGDPMTVRLDESTFLIGRALVGMRPGGRRVLVVPPAQGYGRAGVEGLIPAHATIVFDVERVR